MNKRRNPSWLIKAIVLLLSLIIMVFAMSLAWFSPPDKPVNATGLTVQSSGSTAFDMAVGFETSANGYQYTMTDYSKNFSLSEITGLDGKTYDVLHDFSPIDITGNGVTLVRPSMKNKNEDINRQSSTFTTVTPNREYISFDLYFRSDKECKVFLDSGSFVKGAIEINGGTLTDTSERKAENGDFCKDAIVGAVRVSFVNYDDFIEGEDLSSRQSEPRLLWLPRPDIHLNTKDDNGDDLSPWTLSTGVQPEQIYDKFETVSDRLPAFADTYTHHYFRYDHIPTEDRYVGVDVDNYDTVTDPSRVAICDVDKEINGMYYGKVQVNVWIEGCDAEARRALSGGQFQIKFDLAGG